MRWLDGINSMDMNLGGLQEMERNKEAWYAAGHQVTKSQTRFSDWTRMTESEEELNSLLMKVKEESKKASLKLNIQKTKIMAASLIIWLQVDAETMETVTDFILGGSKITADGDCSLEIKRH